MGLDIHLHDAFFSMHVPVVVIVVLVVAIAVYGAWKLGGFILAALGIWH